MRSDNYCYGEKAVSIRYSVFVSVTLVVLHATGMVYIMSSTASQILLYFSTLSHKRHVFLGGGELN